MKVHIVSDVHGASDALARAADGSDLLIFLELSTRGPTLRRARQIDSMTHVSSALLLGAAGGCLTTQIVGPHLR